MHTKNRPYIIMHGRHNGDRSDYRFFRTEGGGKTVRFCGGKQLRAANVFFYGISVKHGRKGK